MNPRSRGNSAPIKIMAYYLLCLAATMALCLRLLGIETILRYANQSKHYSLLLAPDSVAEQAEAEDTIRIICLGDSNYYYPPSIFIRPGIFVNHLPELNRAAANIEGGPPSLSLSEWAFPGACMFDYYCLFYLALKASPDLIIVPINWRAFGSDYIDHPAWFRPEMSALVPFSERLSSECEDPVGFRGISLVKQLEYKIKFRSVYSTGIKSWALAKIRSFSLLLSRNLMPLGADKGAEAIVKSEEADVDPATLSQQFPMTITGSHPRIHSLSGLAHAAAKHRIHVLFFIWPMDHERLAEAGTLDRPALEQSKRLIRKAVARPNIHFADLSDLLGHDDFHDIHGHARAAGQKKVMEAITPEIVEILRRITASRTHSESAGPSAARKK